MEDSAKDEPEAKRKDPGFAAAYSSEKAKKDRSTSSRSRKKKGHSSVDETSAAIEQQLDDLNKELSEAASPAVMDVISRSGTPTRDGHRQSQTASAIDFEALQQQQAMQTSLQGRSAADNQGMSGSHSARSLGSASTAASTTVTGSQPRSQGIASSVRKTLMANNAMAQQLTSSRNKENKDQSSVENAAEEELPEWAKLDDPKESVSPSYLKPQQDSEKKDVPGYLKPTSGGRKGRAQSADAKGKGKGGGKHHSPLVKKELGMDMASKIASYFTEKEQPKDFFKVVDALKPKEKPGVFSHIPPRAPEKKVPPFDATERCYQKVFRLPNPSLLQELRWRASILEYSSVQCMANFPQPAGTTPSSKNVTKSVLGNFRVQTAQYQEGAAKPGNHGHSNSGVTWAFDSDEGNHKVG